MTTAELEKLIKDNYQTWHTDNPNTDRLARHEAMKAILFNHGLENKKHPTPEFEIAEYDGTGRKGRIDYVDTDTAIEIDDAQNAKSIRKLCYARDSMGKDVYWILILRQGRGGKGGRIAKEKGIKTVRVFARNNHFSVDWII
jgi:hypothetical protein